MSGSGAFVRAVAAGAALALAGCSGDSGGGAESPADGGSAGNAGNAGSAGNAGNGGSSGSSASGGAGGNAGSSGSSGSGGSGGAPVACGGEPEHSGEATYYAADGSGNCSFEATPNDLMVGAMNQTDYDGSNACGACAAIQGPSGSITVRIVDRCPECAKGDIDLSPQAFEQIAPLKDGRVPITWRYVPCGVSGPVSYRFKEGSNQWWSAVQIRNHRHAIAKLEYHDGSGWVNVPRENYNYFVEASGMGPGPYRFRVTDVYGGSVEDDGIAFVEAGEVAGTDQLPACQ